MSLTCPFPPKLETKKSEIGSSIEHDCIILCHGMMGKKKFKYYIYLKNPLLAKLNPPSNKNASFLFHEPQLTITDALTISQTNKNKAITFALEHQ